MNKTKEKVEIEKEIDIEKLRRKQCPKQPKISDILIYLQDVEALVKP